MDSEPRAASTVRQDPGGRGTERATRIDVEPTYEGWHRAARQLLAANTPPDAVGWHERREGQPLLPDLDAVSPTRGREASHSRVAPRAGEGAADAGDSRSAAPEAGTVTPAAGVTVPKKFVDLARRIADRGDVERWTVLYRVLWRLTHGERQLLEHAEDGDVRLLHQLASTARDRAAPGPARPRNGAARTRAVATSRTDDDTVAQRSGVGASRTRVAGGDRRRGGAPATVPATEDLGELEQAAKRCTACDLYKHATQAVFGRGPRSARLVLVGEQPGDQEDRQGLPFVGPAGEVLDRALAEAGIDRAQTYVTNAVKHFKFVLRGKRRIHEKPSSTEVAACRPWLDAELASIHPDVLLCLGATAATAIFGKDFRLLKQRGQWLRTPSGLRAMATIHPSAVLRGPDEAAQGALYAMLVNDLRAAAAALGGVEPPGAAPP